MSETDAVGNSTTYNWVYDDLYRLKQETRTPSGGSAVVTNYDYDRTGNRLYEDVVGGQRTGYTYNALDQMTSISVYGYLLFTTTADEISAIGNPDENTMIEASRDSRVRLYRLPSGEFQVNSPIVDEVRGYLPNGYVFRWTGGCP